MFEYTTNTTITATITITMITSTTNTASTIASIITSTTNVLIIVISHTRIGIMPRTTNIFLGSYRCLSQVQE